MSEETEDELLLRFVNVQSNGGKFQDESFCAGYEMGLLDFRLFQGAIIQTRSIISLVRRDNISQADLIAMRHNAIIAETLSTNNPNYVSCVFVYSH